MLGAGAAVESDDINRHGLHGGNVCGDIGPQQHTPTHIEENLGLYSHIGPVHVFFGAAQTVQRGLDLEDVDAGLDQQHVDAALDEGHGLLAEGVAQLIKRHVAQGRVVRRRQLARGSNRAGHVAVATIFGGIAIGYRAGQPGGGHVDFVDLFAQTPFFEAGFGGLEGAGFEHVGASRQKRAVDLANHVGPGYHEVVAAAKCTLAAVVFGGQIKIVDTGAHCAVIDEHTLGQGLEVGRSRHGCFFLYQLPQGQSHYVIHHSL